VRMDEASWDSVMDTNLKGPFLCMRAVSRAMMDQRSGHIISIASIAGVRGREGQAKLCRIEGRAHRSDQDSSARARQVQHPGQLRLRDTSHGHGGSCAGKRSRARDAENALGRTSNAAEVAAFILHVSLMKHVSGQVFNLDSRVL